MNTNGWERLLCSYFSKTCIDQLAEPLGSDGFEVARVENDGAVIFRRFDVFIEIGYEVETAPAYSPTVVIGFGDKKYDEAGKPAGVPLWFVIRDDEPSKRYSFWKFSTEAELKSVLLRIKDEVLERHASHLWKRTVVLEKLLSNFRAEFGI
jgi:hypothetical protein